MTLLLQMTDTSMLEVPYKGGGPAVIALLGGETQVIFVGIGSVAPALKENRLRAVAVSSEKRLKQFPDVPAVAGTLPRYEMTACIGSFVPAGTPRPIVAFLKVEFREALRHPDSTKILSAHALDPMPMTVDQFDWRLRADYEKHQKPIGKTGAAQSLERAAV